MQQLIEASPIQSQTMPLEKENEDSKPKTSAVFKMVDILGQFLRYMHLILICSLQEENKRANMYPTNPYLSQ